MLAVAAMSVWAMGGATIPSGYYDSLEGKSGEALKNAIHDPAPHGVEL